MLKVLANDGIHAAGKSALELAGFQVDTDNIPQEELSTKLNDYDALVVRSATKVRKALIDACPNLKIIARAGVGMDNIDVEYARSKGVQVVNTPKASSLAVAELVIGNMFTLARMLHRSNREMPTDGGQSFKKLKKSYAGGVQLKGKTLGIIGFGRIGQALAKLALGLGMKVVASSRTPKELTLQLESPNLPGKSFDIPFKTVSMEEVLKESDFISLHVPSQDKALIGANEIALMKPSAFVINSARGGSIDEQALLEALDKEQLAGAALDVFVNEPKPNTALLAHAKIAVTPHIGASTVEAQANIGTEVADAFISFFK